MKPSLETLEDRTLPTATVAGGLLLVNVAGTGDHTVSIDSVGGQVQVNQDGILTSFDPTTITSILVNGSATARNVVQNNTGIDSVLLGGNLKDTIFGGGGRNVIDPGGGNDTVYSLGGVNNISVAGDGVDAVFTNIGAVVVADDKDLVVRFFGPGRTPGTPFIGLDSSLGDGVLYITPSNNGSSVLLLPGAGKGDVVAIYDLGDGNGLSVQTFSNVQAISYFGGTGNDTYQNDTSIREAAYGSAGNDSLTGGYGGSVLKGSGGNDVLVGRSRQNDLSGNGGTDVLVVLTQGGRDIFRVDALDVVFGMDQRDVFITP